MHCGGFEMKKEDSSSDISIDISEASPRKKIDQKEAAKAFKKLIKTNPELDCLAADPNLKERLKKIAEKEVRTASGAAFIERVQALQDKSPIRSRGINAITHPTNMRDVALEITKKMHQEEVVAHTETKKELEIKEEEVKTKDKEIELKQMEIDSQRRTSRYQLITTIVATTGTVLVSVAAALGAIYAGK